MVWQILQTDQRQRSSCFILQQIIDLKRLQLTEGSSNPSPLIHGQEQINVASSMRHYTKKGDENLDQTLQNSPDPETDPRQRESTFGELKCDPFPCPFPQLDRSPSSSNVGIPLQGEPLWQCKSPVQSSQVWTISLKSHSNEFLCWNIKSITICRFTIGIIISFTCVIQERWMDCNNLLVPRKCFSLSSEEKYSGVQKNRLLLILIWNINNLLYH